MAVFLARIWCWLTVSVLVAAGAGCARMHPTPFTDPVGAEFSGLLRVTPAPSPVRVIWVHGMCHHDKGNWVDGRVKAISEKLRTEMRALPHTVLDHQGRRVEVYPYRGDVSARPLEIRFLVWSDLTLAAKGKLCFDVKDDPVKRRIRRPRFLSRERL